MLEIQGHLVDKQMQLNILTLLISSGSKKTFQFTSPHISISLTGVSNGCSTLLSEHLRIFPVGRGFSEMLVSGTWEEVLQKEISKILLDIPPKYAEERRQLLNQYKKCL